MEFKVRQPSDMEAVLDYLGGLPAGKPYDVTIVLHRDKRSDPQNALYWSWVGLVARETGNDRDTVHKVFAKKFLGTEVTEIAGEKIGRIKSTAKLSKEDFSEYLNQVEAFCLTELGMRLPHPEDSFYEQLIGNEQ